MDTFDVDNIAEPVFGMQVGKGFLYNLHPQERCAGRPCVIHNPSDHHMKDWPLNWRADKSQMERLCSHGTGHPDPDDLDYHKSQGRDWMSVHGCDGCCIENFGGFDAL
jgi:hypothetical protein